MENAATYHRESLCNCCALLRTATATSSTPFPPGLVAGASCTRVPWSLPTSPGRVRQEADPKTFDPSDAKSAEADSQAAVLDDILDDIPSNLRLFWLLLLEGGKRRLPRNDEAEGMGQATIGGMLNQTFH